MARPRQTTTTETPTRAPRKPTKASTGDQGRKTPQKPPTGRQRASGKAKPNKFDDIARAVAQDDTDLAKQLQASITQPKANPVVTRHEAKAVGKELATERQATARSAKQVKTAPKATGNGVTFSGRPTTKVETVAARVKQLGLRVRADADVDAIAARLRATPDAVSAWMASRNGTPTKTTTTKPETIKAKQQRAKARDKARPPTITLGHVWGDKRPDWLYRCTLVTRYEVRPDGSVWTTLHQVLGPDGKVLKDFWRLPLDYRPTQEVQGNGRKLVLKDRTITGLQTWLIREGLTTAEDITVTK